MVSFGGLMVSFIVWLSYFLWVGDVVNCRALYALVGTCLPF